MILKTRNNRKVQIETIELCSLSEIEKKRLVDNIFNFSIKNTQNITREYLLKRFTNYNLICLALNNDTIVGFGFADCRNMTFGFFKKIPLIHFGLMIIDKEWRGDRVSRLISISTVKFVIKKSGLKIFLTGFAISAKCSSPVSFYRLQQASLKFGFPKFNNKGDLHYLSKTRFGKTLSKNVSQALNLHSISDFVILNSNTESGFSLSKEAYVTNSAYEEKVLSFFNKNVIPNHEVLFVTYAHPLMAL